MTNLKRFTLLFAVFVLAGCSSSPAATLAANRQKWQGRQVSHYRYDLAVGCFCAFTSVMPVTVEVKDGKTVSMVGKDGQSAAQFQSALAQYAPMDKLFDVIKVAADAHAYQLQVDYDPDYGYPDAIRIDYSQNVSDDEISFTVSNFALVP